ncbi:MAG: ATP-binding protein [Paludibacteraceae bacterium]|nr:ATP-binding protein [Paludibacteraceae bacterium]
MYEDSRCIYREYVQNAADQIDIACEQHLDPSNYYDIQIWIDEENRRIEIEDTATGVSKERVNLLRDVACSTKHRGKQKGFRGIGRLGGLGYCSNLIFITSFKGEDVQTIMRWDADRMNQLIDDEMDDSEAGAVIDQCVSYEYKHEDSEKHYFRVVMEHVTDDKLLQVDAISQYLSMVAPVDYPTAFSKFGHQIKQYMRDNNLSLDTYNLFVNGDQIYKGYTTRIVDAKNGDYDVTDIQFFSQKDSNEKFLYWGWYSVSELRGQIPAYNIPYGMRLRCKNIQIGDETTCRRFFNADGDRRFAQYFYGEVNVVNPDLQPDGRRDYFREGDLRRHFEKLLTTDFQILKVLCNEASDIRGTVKKFTTAVNGQETIQKKTHNGICQPSRKG